MKMEQTLREFLYEWLLSENNDTAQHVSPEEIDVKLEGIIEIVEEYMEDDLTEE